ncbi:MAG: ABC transporter ATP-binding protein [Candidatus Melainabacteria bacterium]|nr:ABC transporter ATP-binding protein [Candidatus Melainabacteria bacterium]
MSEPTIETIDLSKSFGKRTVVDKLNLKVYPGELYALLGDNGAGKTTSISMLTTLLKPTSGTFKVCGFDGRKYPEKAKGCFGIVSQDVAIYHELTAYENLKFIADLHGIAPAIAKQRILELLQRAELLDRMNDRAGEFSGGMQRKLTIAGAMLHSPQVLFMDEPTVGLDPAARRQIWQSLKELKTLGVTVLLTTHYLEEAELLADRVGIIRGGKIVAEGTIEELRHKIKGIRGIAIRLTEFPDHTKLQAIMSEFQSRFGGDAQYDALRNTISVSRASDTRLVESLQSILTWLSENDVSFSRFATSEPNLEEVFLAIANDQKEIVLN